MQKNKKLSLCVSNLSSSLLAILMIVTPIFILPIIDTPLIRGKILLALLTGLVFLIFFALRSIKYKKFELNWTPFSFYLVLFGFSALLSSFFSSQYSIDSLLGLGGVYLAMTVIALFGGSLIKKNLDKFNTYLVISSLVLIVLSVLDMFGFGVAKLLTLIFKYEIPKGLGFNLSGSTFIALQLLLVTLVSSVAEIIHKKMISALHLFAIPVIIFGLVLFGFSLLPGKETSLSLQPFQSSWNVAIQSLKTTRSALIGFGPNSYLDVFYKYKPLWLNNTDKWNVAYNTANNVPLTFIPTLGLIGFIVWCLFVIKFFSVVLKNKETLKLSSTWAIITILLIQLFTPINIVLFIILAISLAYWSAEQKGNNWIFEGFVITKGQNPRTIKAKAVIYTISVITLLGVFPALFIIGKNYLALYKIYRANAKMMSNEAVAVYDNLRQAVALSPYIDTTRRNYALVNMQIAIALSNKKDATDQEKEQVVQLVNQAIQEAKAATVINPNNTTNWLVLAEIYKQLIGIAEGADQWTVTAMVNAIETNPNNPLLRINLGELFLNHNNPEQAASFYGQAINLKPDLAMGYYQLGRAGIAAKDYKTTKVAWEKAITLLPQDSPDYKTIQEQLVAINEQIKALGLDSESVDTTGGELMQKGKEVPSVTEQNVNNSAEDIVNKPATKDMDIKDVDEKEIPAIKEKAATDLGTIDNKTATSSANQ